MLGWLKTIISGGASTLVDSIGNAIDKCTTQDEERLALKNQLAMIMAAHEETMLKQAQDYEAAMEKEITTRWEADMKEGSILSRNIRPLSLAFLTVATVILAYFCIFTLTPTEVALVTPWKDLLQLLLLTCYAGYFGARTLEKVTKIKQGNEGT